MHRVVRLLPKVVIGITLTILVVGFITWKKIPQILSSELSKRANVAVKLDTIRVTPWSLTIKDFEISSPKGYHLKKAFSMKKARVYASLFNYLKPRTIIQEMTLKDVYLGIEFDSPTDRNGNWTIIINNLNQSVNKEIAADPTPSAKSVLIKKVDVFNIDVQVGFRNKPKEVKTLPTIQHLELTNIDSKEGAPIRQIMSSVLGELIKSVVVKENLKNIIQDTVQLKTGPVRSVLKGLFGGTAPLELPQTSLEQPESPSPED